MDFKVLCQPSIYQAYVRSSIVASISACHAEDLGSIPSFGGFFWQTEKYIQSLKSCNY